MRVCKQCSLEQPLEEYHLNKLSAGGRKPVCKTCRNKITREHRATHGRTETPEQRRKWQLKAKYGVSLEDYAVLANEQDNKCKICGAGHDKGQAGFLVVDHCHTTGRVRGLLCSNCNSALGLFRDEEESLKNAIRYLADTGF